MNKRASGFSVSALTTVAGFVIGAVIAASLYDFGLKQGYADLADFLGRNQIAALSLIALMMVSTIAGFLVGKEMDRRRAIWREFTVLKERQRNAEAARQLATVEKDHLAELLDQESGLFVGNWEELVAEKDKLRDELDISGALLGLSSSLGSLAGPDQVLETIAEVIPATIFCDGCITMSYDEAARKFHVRASSGVGGGAAKAAYSSTQFKALGEALKTGKPVSVDHADESLVPIGLIRDIGLTAALVLPLAGRGDVIGAAVAVYTATPYKPTKRNLAIAEGIVSQANLALDNAQLYQETIDRHAEVQRVLTLLASSQEDERRRISRDLHDGVVQNLSGMIFSLSFLGKSLGKNSGAEDELAQLQQLVETTIADIRKVIYDLRPTMLDTLGLVPTLEKHLDRFSEANSLQAHLDGPKGTERLSEVLETGIFRFVQEALNNIKKHAQASEVKVRLTRSNGRVRVIIEDDGKGFDLATVAKRASQDSGFGLSGMRERIQALGGQLDIVSKPGKGTKVSATIPVEATERTAVHG